MRSAPHDSRLDSKNASSEVKKAIAHHSGLSKKHSSSKQVLINKKKGKRIMQKVNSDKYQQFGRLFGREVHMLETSQLDPSYKLKEELHSIKKPAILCTIKSIKSHCKKNITG